MPATIDAVQGRRVDGRDRQRARGRLRALRRDAGLLSRIERFTAAVADAGLAGALVMHPVSVYYLAGTGQPCNLLVRPGEEPILFARRYIDLVRAKTDVERVVEGAGFSAVAREAKIDGPLGMELDVVPAALVERAKRGWPEIADCSALLWDLRAVKDAGEVAAMRESVKLFDALHATMLEHLRPGITELELAAELDRGLRLAGHDGVIFQHRWDAKMPMEGALASGENLARMSRGPFTITGVGLSEAFPMGASRREIRRGDLVAVDLGLNRAGYHADMSRSYAVEELPDGIAGLAATTRELQDVALAAIRPGVTAESVYDAAHEAAQRLGVERRLPGRRTRTSATRSGSRSTSRPCSARAT